MFNSYIELLLNHRKKYISHRKHKNRLQRTATTVLNSVLRTTLSLYNYDDLMSFFFLSIIYYTVDCSVHFLQLIREPLIYLYGIFWTVWTICLFCYDRQLGNKILKTIDKEFIKDLNTAMSVQSALNYCRTLIINPIKKTYNDIHVHSPTYCPNNAKNFLYCVV